MHIYTLYIYKCVQSTPRGSRCVFLNSALSTTYHLCHTHTHTHRQKSNASLDGQTGHKSVYNQFWVSLILIRAIIATHSINVRNNADGVQSNQKCAQCVQYVIRAVGVPLHECVHCRIFFFFRFRMCTLKTTITSKVVPIFYANRIHLHSCITQYCCYVLHRLWD